MLAIRSTSVRLEVHSPNTSKSADGASVVLPETPTWALESGPQTVWCDHVGVLVLVTAAFFWFGVTAFARARRRQAQLRRR